MTLDRNVGRRTRRPATALIRRFAGTAAALVASAWPGGAGAQTYDVLIRGGRVLDGTGAAERVADVAVAGGRVVAVGELARARARRVIDAAGLYVVPGFIDMHSHGDRGLGLPGLRAAWNDLTQGITTIVVGQDGRSAWPVGGKIQQTIEQWTRHGIGLNAILLVGHGSVRREVMGDANRDPTPEELARMRALVREAMEGGAWGISTGLSYVPGRFAKTEEVIALTAEVKPYGGFYISHLRNQGDRLLESVDETVRIGRETGVTVVATHFKSSGRANFGKARPALERIDAARRAGVRIYTDVYPWATSSDGIDVDVLPAEVYRIAGEPDPDAARAREAVRRALETLGNDELAAIVRARGGAAGGADPAWIAARPREELLDMAAAALAPRGEERRRLALRLALEDSAKRAEIRRVVRAALDRRGADLDVIERAPDPRIEGLTLAAAADVLGLDLADAAIAIDLMDAQVTNFHMSEQDVEEILRWPFTAIGTDGTIPYFGEGVAHPRSYGTYPRLIRHYVFQQGVIPLPEAIRRATGLPAEILGLEDRGLLRPGQAADIVVFDPLTIDACATYRNPHCYSRGVEYLLVNGTLAIDQGRYTGALAGRVLLPPRGARAVPAPTGGGER